MKRDEFQEILSELKDVKNEIREVRQTDIPSIKIDVAGFHDKIRSLEKSQGWSTKLYTIIGGAITVAIVKFTGHQ